MNYLLAGISLGFAAGISPGPLMTLVISKTLERGLGAGLRVAVAPLLTDALIIVLSLLFFRVLPPGLETLLTAGGALFVLYLAWEIIRDARHASLTGLAHAQTSGASADIWRGMLVNFVSPHPWLFWIGVAAPLLTQAWASSPMDALGFLVGFYIMLVGSKVLMAFGIAGGRRFVNDRWYRRLLLASGLLLALFGLLLLWQAVAPILG